MRRAFLAACGPCGLASSQPARGFLDGNAMLPISTGDHLAAQAGFEVYDVCVFSGRTGSRPHVADGRQV